MQIAVHRSRFKQGIPLTAFESSDIEADQRLKKARVDVHDETDRVRTGDPGHFCGYLWEFDPVVSTCGEALKTLKR